MSATTTEISPATTSNDFLDVLYRRRAVRSYTPDTVDEHVVRELLDAAVHAPTAMHQEPWRFVVVQDRTALLRISERAKSMAREQAAHHGKLLRAPGAAGDGIASVLADPDFNIFYDAGTLVVICAEPSNDFVAADCWLAAENLMLAACARGLGSCCIGFAVQALNAPDTKRELAIPANVQAFVPLILGVPRTEPDVVPRRPAAVVSWVR